MTDHRRICAVVPVKELARAKQRFSSVLAPATRQALAHAMLEDVLSALSATRELAGMLVVTIDPAAAAIARRFDAEVSENGASESHTGAVRAAATLLASRNISMLALPGDVPLVTPDDIFQLIAAHAKDSSSFTIVPARDQQGSNAILCSPADAVPLRFGDNSFFPHLSAARAQGIEPRVVRLSTIELDIDTPEDLEELYSLCSHGHTRKILDQAKFAVRSHAFIHRQSA
jgi:2-phospho-L-lactate/phosphoenolpyruvate guanylyltransferase